MCLSLGPICVCPFPFCLCFCVPLPVSVAPVLCVSFLFSISQSPLLISVCLPLTHTHRKKTDSQGVPYTLLHLPHSHTNLFRVSTQPLTPSHVLSHRVTAATFVIPSQTPLLSTDSHSQFLTQRCTVSRFVTRYDHTVSRTTCAQHTISYSATVTWSLKMPHSPCLFECATSPSVTLRPTS